MNNNIKAFITSPRGKYYLALYGVCVVFFGIVVAGLYSHGKLLMWTTDVVPLYYNYFVYEGEALREAFASLFAGNGFALNLYSFSLGYGADVLTSGESFLSEPLNLLSVFIPAQHAHWGFIFLVLVRFALCATTFSWYCFHRGHKEIPTFVATLCFVFSGFVLFWGFFRHPNFLTMALILPLILEGADKIFEGKKPYQFIAAAFLIFLVSIYFAYMLCLILLVYCLIKYFFTRENRGMRDFSLLVGKMLVCLLIGALIAAAIWLPTVEVLLQAGRVGLDRQIPLLEDSGFYRNFIRTLVSGTAGPAGAFIGAIPVFLVVLFLVGKKTFSAKTWWSWTVGIACCLVAALIPWFGSLFNGLAYSTDRWMFVFPFCTSYIVCLVLPKLNQISSRAWVAASIISAILAVIALVSSLGKSQSGVFSAVLLILLVVGFACWRVFVRKKESLSSSQHAAVLTKMTCCVLSVVVLISAGLAVWDLRASRYGMVKTGTPWNSIYNNDLARFAENIAGPQVPGVSINEALNSDQQQVTDAGLYRFDVPYNNRLAVSPLSVKNSGLNYRTLFVSFYSSIYNQNVDTFRSELGLSDHVLNYSFAGEDSRFALEAFTGVKYVFAHPNYLWRMPATYEPTSYRFSDYGSKSGWEAYKTSYASSLGFITEKLISQSSYANLNMVQKQEALLQATVLPDDAQGVIENAQTCEFASTKKACDVVYGEGIQPTSNGCKVTKKDATITFTFNSDAYAENYLYFENLDFNDPLDTGKGSSTERWFTGSMNGNKTEFKIVNSADSDYGGKHNWVLFVGRTNEQKSTTITLTFAGAGNYTFNELGVASQPINPLIEHAKKRQEAGIEDIELVINGVNASFALDSDEQRYAVFTFPYSAGWTAEVDGQETKIEKADTAFMAIPVSGKGEHTIKMHYITPGLKEGACLGALGLVGLIAVVCCQRRKQS